MTLPDALRNRRQTAPIDGPRAGAGAGCWPADPAYGSETLGPLGAHSRGTRPVRRPISAVRTAVLRARGHLAHRHRRSAADRCMPRSPLLGCALRCRPSMYARGGSKKCWDSRRLWRLAPQSWWPDACIVTMSERLAGPLQARSWPMFWMKTSSRALHWGQLPAQPATTWACADDLNRRAIRPAAHEFDRVIGADRPGGPLFCERRGGHGPAKRWKGLTCSTRS